MMENRFRILPLEGLVNFKTGKLNSNAAKPDGIFPFFTCSQETLRTDTWSFNGEYVLLAGNNAAGVYPLKYFNGKFDAYQRTYAISTKDENVLVTRYVYYALRLQLEIMKSISTGAATKFLTLSLLNQTRIPVPPLPSQHKISTILSAYDELIETNLRRIKILEEMAQNIYREWFVKFRFPGHEHSRFVDSPFGKIPVGWDVKRIGDAFQTLLGGTPSRNRTEFWCNGTVPWINSGKVNNLRITEPSELITELALEKSATKLMPLGTTLIAITGATLGQVSFLEIEACANQSVVGVISKDKNLIEWLHLTIKERISNIINRASGGAQQHINKGIVDEVIVAIPSGNIAEGFRNIAHPLYRQIARLINKNGNLRRTRDLLLPRLISGQLDVSELNITVPEEIGA